MSIIIKRRFVAENIADYLDNSFSNPYDRTFYASKEGRYIIKAKVHDLVIGNIIDTIEFEQIVETGDETIIAMDLQQKILRALQLTDWKVELDFAALSEALFTATGVIIAIAAIAVIAPEVAGAIVAIMTIGQGIDAAINMIKGIMQLSEALNLIDKARSKRALKVGGEKLKEGILNIGVGIIEALLAKCTMKNLANARTQVLKNVTPQPAVLPPAAGNPAPRLPELPIGREELTVILNKSAANAVENAARMSIPQSEKTALREMTDSSQAYKHINPEQTAEISKETAKKYEQKIKWGINTINVRKEGKGFWGERMSQHNIRVDKYELKINPNNESFYLPHPMGGFVQFENLKNKTVQDGKLILTKKSFYHVADLPDFAREKALQEARRQIEAATLANYKIEWLISDKKAVNQLIELFILNYVNIKVSFYLNRRNE